MQWIEEPGLHVEISAVPVDQETYHRYLTHSDQSHSHYPTAPPHPLVGVSATDALAFVTWLAGQDGRPYRLPTIDELAWLAKQNGSLNIWPCRPYLTPAGHRPTCLYEWLDCRPHLGGAGADLHCATHPAWLLAAAPNRVIHAAFADAGFPYVTFRLVR